MTAAVPEGWEGILAPGERILWQGRPDGRLTLRSSGAGQLIGGLAFAAMGLVWMAVALGEGEVLGALMGLPHVAVGLGLAVGPVFWSAHVRRHSWYTLTDRRAIVATDYWPKGKALRDWPIGPDSPLALMPGTPAGVQVAIEERLRNKRTVRVPVGFERIAEAGHVLALMQGIARGAPE
jgi:hypothetical protein